MKYEIFWKVYGDSNEKFEGSDIIEVDRVIDMNDADSLAGNSLESYDVKPSFNNFTSAVNDKCLTICQDWKITKIKKCTEENKIANKTPLNKGVASGTLCQQDERARTVVGDMASSEVSLDASKSDSNKRDGSPADTTQSDTKKSGEEL